MMKQRRTASKAAAKLTEEQTQLIAKALADARRYDILKFLGGMEGAGSCESMRGCVEIAPATLSHHMKELEGAGLVTVERKGKFAFYRLERGVLEAYLGRLRKDLVQY